MWASAALEAELRERRDYGVDDDTILQLNYQGIQQITEDDIKSDKFQQAVCLYLKKNLLKTLPGAVEQLSNLVRLHVVGNELEALPREIGNLVSLEVLDVSANVITSLPSTIGQLQTLLKLHVCDNRLVQIPKEIGELKLLSILELSQNYLSSLPEELSKCSNLTLLAADKNRLRSFPRQLCKLNKLTELSLCGNQLEYIPQAVCFLENLKWLNMDNNPALSSLPMPLGKLVFCDIGLHGCFQKNVQPLVHSRHVVVKGKRIAIPDEIECICKPGVNCVPTLIELAYRGVDRNIADDEDMLGELPHNLKGHLRYPTALCSHCEGCLFIAAFPAVMEDNSGSTQFVGLFCSLKCLRECTDNTFKVVYPY